MQSTIQTVKRFWEQNPLFSGESVHPVGSMEFFQEHRRICREDCCAGRLDARIFPSGRSRRAVLDLGCGPGFWTIELGLRGCDNLVAADLTDRALSLAQKRCQLYGVEAEFVRENAERLTFGDGTFSHVNCQGVIHHTPDREACVREIARILEPGGSASISVYFRNLALRLWPVLCVSGRLMSRLGFQMKGRGREGILGVTDTSELVRCFDGKNNPIGESYSKADFRALLEPHFEILDFFFHLFPARALPFKLPARLHRILDRHCPFMIYASLRKR